jgi:hypothetical protein
VIRSASTIHNNAIVTTVTTVLKGVVVFDLARIQPEIRLQLFQGVKILVAASNNLGISLTEMNKLLNAWILQLPKLQNASDEYDILPEDYADASLHKKAIAMLRGLAFEPAIRRALRKLGIGSELSGKERNDLLLDNGEEAEAKLAKGRQKKTYIKCRKQHELLVKCHHSRSKREKAILAFAERLNLPVEVVRPHHDLYYDTEFAYLFTSIGNGFYHPVGNAYKYAPTDEQREWLRHIGIYNQKQANNAIYVARAVDLTPKATGIPCPKKTCPDRYNCRFLPNYPKICWKPGEINPLAPWVRIEDFWTLLKDDENELSVPLSGRQILCPEHYCTSPALA